MWLVNFVSLKPSNNHKYPFFTPACRYFDKDQNGKLEHHEFKACLRSLGYDLPVLEQGQTDPEYEAIMDQVDPNRFSSALP